VERAATAVPLTSRMSSIASAEKAKSEALFSVSVFAGDNFVEDEFLVGRIVWTSVSNVLVPVLKSSIRFKQTGTLLVVE
jgi:hypothetical protein